MDVYVIPPINNLELVEQGNRAFCLAHLYLTNKKYRDYFNSLKYRSDRPWYVTLDNGAAEHSLVTEDVLIEAVKELQPDEVIAPDVLFNKKKTLDNLYKFIERLKKEKLINKVKVFGCPQGETQQEWLQCYMSMITNAYVDVIGLSKISVPYCWANKSKGDTNIMKARQDCVNYLYVNKLLFKPLHLLGMGNPDEYKAYKKIPFIRSTDSCYTIFAAWKGVEFGAEDFKRVPTDNSYFNTTLTEEQKQLAIKNIKYLLNISKGI